MRDPVVVGQLLLYMRTKPKKADALIAAERRIIIIKLCESFYISHGSLFSWVQLFGYSKINAKWVSRMLTDCEKSESGCCPWSSDGVLRFISIWALGRITFLQWLRGERNNSHISKKAVKKFWDTYPRSKTENHNWEVLW